MAIPRITHQTAPEGALPGVYAQLRQRLVALHPNWEHRFYDDADCRELFRCELPQLLGLYDGYPVAVQRADLFRVAAVYLFGGFYVDLDVVGHRPLDDLCGHPCVLAEEKTLSPSEATRFGHAHPLRIANYMFGAEPRHPFWLDLLAAMLEEADRPIATDDDVLESTGPGLLTRVFHRAAEGHPGIVLLRNRGTRCDRCGGVSCSFGDHASHLHLGSWRGPGGHQSGNQVVGAGAVPSTPLDREPVERWLSLERRNGREHFVLTTYSGSQRDGLSAVFEKLGRVGTLVGDTRHLADATVLVAGVPFLYLDRLSPRNRNVLYTTFETSRLPGQWVETINRHYHHCIVPHPAVARVFADSGIRLPMTAIQQGFTRYRRGAGRQDGFRVGFAGVPVERKNLDKLYEACAQLVEVIPELRLAVHVSHYYDWMDRGPSVALREAPFVDWSEGVLSRQRMSGWWGGLSCYAFPSSGEGWSFTPREALFLGIPTVLSDIPVHRELIESGFCRPIPSRGTEAAGVQAGATGELARIEVGDIREAILAIYQDLEQETARARAGSRWMEGRWLESDTELEILDLLDSIGSGTGR